MPKPKIKRRKPGGGRKPSPDSMGASVAVRLPVALLARRDAVVPRAERSEWMRREIERGVAREERAATRWADAMRAAGDGVPEAAKD